MKAVQSMCKVKTGTDVQTAADLQNLVTSVILRQVHPFSKDTIKEQVLSKLEGSEFSSDDEKKTQVLKLCDRTLKFMVLSSSIRSKGMDDNRYRLTLSFPSYHPSMIGAE